MRAETLFRQENFTDAILDYTKIENSFKRSRYLDDSLYKMGLAYDALGEKEVAQGYYEELVARHPKSSFAKLAQKKLGSTKRSKSSLKKKISRAR